MGTLVLCVRLGEKINAINKSRCVLNNNNVEVQYATTDGNFTKTNKCTR